MKHVIDHVQLSVTEYPAAKAFYEKALAPLGFSLMMEFPPGGAPSHGGFGVGGKPFFWLTSGSKQTPLAHIAFGAETRADVDAFYHAAIAAGGTDNGAPGLRPHYHEHYYGAFIRDPEGHNIEAVCHAPA